MLYSRSICNLLSFQYIFEIILTFADKNLITLNFQQWASSVKAQFPTSIELN